MLIDNEIFGDRSKISQNRMCANIMHNQFLESILRKIILTYLRKNMLSDDVITTACVFRIYGQ